MHLYYKGQSPQHGDVEMCCGKPAEATSALHVIRFHCLAALCGTSQLQHVRTRGHGLTVASTRSVCSAVQLEEQSLRHMDHQPSSSS